MAQNFLKSNSVLIRLINRSTQYFAAQKRNISSSSDIQKSLDIKKSVFISQSNDIYTNLALEDWMYKNFDFSNHHILMLWQNDPCIVIGRHQNPWLEANIPGLVEQSIQLARRNSGGGTVFHDKGNLNLTFFTPRERYSRKYNLELITRALFRKYGLTANISPREDLTVRDSYKISGTAAKLGRPNAYHHCTLLVNVNKLDLSQALQKRQTGIKTNATKSFPAPVMNLCEEVPSMNVETLMEAVGWEYLRTDPIIVKDCGEKFINQQKGFSRINPTDQWFPGLNAIRDELASWDWCYGKTPEFCLERLFPIPNHILADSYSGDQELKITVQVKQGKITDVILNIPPGLSATGLQGDVKVITSLQGCKFTEEAMNTLESSLALDNILAADKDKFVTECVRQVMTSV